MKKIYFLMAAALVGLAACTSNKKPNVSDIEAEVKENFPDVTTAVYEGVLPAADCDGIRYTLNLASKNDTTGVYELTMTYLPEGEHGTPDISHGNYEVFTGMPNNPDGRYMRMIQTVDKSNPGTYVDTLYFAIDSDSTVTLVGSDLVPSDSPLNYTLTKL